MKLELITDADWHEIQKNAHTPREELENINALIEEKLEHGTCELRKDGGSTPYLINSLCTPTHNIWYITTPIEPEKIECDHVFKIEFKTCSPMVFDNGVFDFCPKCGAKLS